MSSRHKNRSLRGYGGATLAAVVVTAAALPFATGCKRDVSLEPAALTVTSAAVENDSPPAEISKTAKLASIAMQTNIYSKPNDTSRKLGYLRLGAIVPRSDKSYGNEGCPGGWYGVAPRGYVCVGKNGADSFDDRKKAKEICDKATGKDCGSVSSTSSSCHSNIDKCYDETGKASRELSGY